MMWKDSYKIGVEEVDRQHKELFERLSNFIKVLRSDGEWEAKIPEVKKTLNFMGDYVDEHFDSEEEYQEEIGYPEREEHKEIHEKFKAEIADFAKRFEEEGYEKDLALEFSGKLMAWLINHVANTDQKLGDYADSLEEEAE